MLLPTLRGRPRIQPQPFIRAADEAFEVHLRVLVIPSTELAAVDLEVREKGTGQLISHHVQPPRPMMELGPELSRCTWDILGFVGKLDDPFEMDLVPRPPPLD